MKIKMVVGDGRAMNEVRSSANGQRNDVTEIPTKPACPTKRSHDHACKLRPYEVVPASVHVFGMRGASGIYMDLCYYD